MSHYQQRQGKAFKSLTLLTSAKPQQQATFIYLWLLALPASTADSAANAIFCYFNDEHVNSTSCPVLFCVPWPFALLLSHLILHSYQLVFPLVLNTKNATKNYQRWQAVFFLFFSLTAAASLCAKGVTTCIVLSKNTTFFLSFADDNDDGAYYMIIILFFIVLHFNHTTCTHTAYMYTYIFSFYKPLSLYCYYS